jgi:hypothetical protein
VGCTSHVLTDILAQVLIYGVPFIQCGMQKVKQLLAEGTIGDGNTDGHILMGCAGSIVYTCEVS